MTVDDVLSRVRSSLMDDIDGDYRHSNDKLIDFLKIAVRDLVADRPALRLQSDGTLYDVDGSGGMTDFDTVFDILLVDDSYLRALSSHVTAQVHMEEDADDYNSRRAVKLFEVFKSTS